jgi:membrane fusion protein (multidrug efflux system)
MLFFDASSGSLWAQSKQLASSDDRVAVSGMAGWSARTGLACASTVSGDDPRFDALIDDPDGDGADQLMVQPIIGADARVHAVLVAVRSARAAPLGAEDANVLARFAGFAAPLLDQLSTHIEGMEILDAEADASAAPRFRKEAVEAADVRRWGDIVRVSPRWLSWGYWMLVVLLAGSVAMLVLGRVATYSTGPAVVRSMARTTIVARTSGNVSTLAVAPGDRVRAGAPIARLDDVDQRAAVERIERDFETQLRNHMVDPGDQAADSALRSLRQALDQARTALEERTIVAPADGVISDLRVRPGQHLEPGDIAASVVDGDAGLEVVALLPGEDRPQLAPGMTIRLELTGYRYAYQSIVIESTSSDVIAPAEARRVLGAEVAEGMRLGGPVVIVRGRIPSLSFDADGRTFTYHDGMLGTAEVQIREERIMFALVPGMRRFGD